MMLIMETQQIFVAHKIECCPLDTIEQIFPSNIFGLRKRIGKYVKERKWQYKQ